ncbi:MAG TPA: tyrosine--tRNA ligase [Polyangia bacterium]|jgi:tyrosyl-tRNA synthetase|nr:tyrosine--tRNA ligase [Polyangia bacterium]
MASSASNSALEVLRARGFVQQISDEAELGRRLASDAVTFYAGFDPTAPSLHVGHYIPLLAMAHLARAGHKAIAVLGGGTAMVGDPSGKSEMRQLITQEAIQSNRRQIEPQVRRIIGDNAAVVDNADWLLPLNYVAFLRDIGRHFSVNRMLAAEAYKLRLEKGLSFIEFNYQLLQAYDFLVLNERYGCALQIGGDDQWGNIVAGIDLIRRVRQADAFGLTFPLLTTGSGAKMGKTATGAVWLDPNLTKPYDFYQYFVNVDDRDVIRFLKLLTFEPVDEIARYAALEGAELREAKHALAHAITTIVHGSAAADEARHAAKAAFGGGGADDATVPTFVVDSGQAGSGIKIVDLLALSGLAASRSAARRLIEQGGVRFGDRKIASIDDTVTAGDIGGGTLLYAGKKHLRRIIVG